MAAGNVTVPRQCHVAGAYRVHDVLPSVARHVFGYIVKRHRTQGALLRNSRGMELP